jgi:hypothetical protein
MPGSFENGEHFARERLRFPLTKGLDEEREAVSLDDAEIVAELFEPLEIVALTRHTAGGAHVITRRVVRNAKKARRETIRAELWP